MVETSEPGSAVQAFEEQAAAILSIAADAIITVDADQTIVRFNRGAEEIFGYTADTIIGQPLSRLLPPRLQEMHARHMHAFARAPEAARRMGERREILGLRSDGTEFPAEASIAKLATEDGLLFTVMLRDITERRRNEATERFLAALSDTMARSLEYEATVRTAAQFPIPTLGDICIVTSFSQDDQPWQRITSEHPEPERAALLHTLEEFHEPIWLVHAHATGLTPETPVELVPDVTPLWLDTNVPNQRIRAIIQALGVRSLITLPLVAREHVVGTLSVLRTTGRPYDSTDLAVTEAAARRIALAMDNTHLYQTARRATRLRDEVLGVVSHDLRNPLSTIEMLARVLAESPPAEESARRDLARAMTAATEWANRLIRDLLDVSMIEAGRLSISRTREALEPIVEQAVEMVHPMATAQSLTLRTKLAPDLPVLLVDAERVLQLLSNLLGNAVKFTPAGGTITVTGANAGNVVVLSVADTGPGITPDQLPHVFDRYWRVARTGKQGGSGLGLAIAKGIVEAHGGRIWVESVLGAGAKFSVALPIAAGTLPERVTQESFE